MPASWDGRKEHLPGLRETAHFPETQGTQAALSDSRASRKPASLEITLGILTGDFLDPKQGVLQAKPLRQGENFSPGLTYGSGQKGAPRVPRGAGSKEPRLCSSASSGAAGRVPPRREGGEVTLQEQVHEEEESTASCPPDAAPARITVQVEARGGLAWELGDPQRAPPGTLMASSLPLPCWAGRLGRGCPVLLAPQSENCVMSFGFPRKKPETW